MPDILYHYTSIAALNGIVKDKFVWASSLHFMNDAQEHAYGIQLIQTLLKERFRRDIQREYGESDFQTAFELSRMFDLLERLAGAMGLIEWGVFSMTARGNLLSQWRGYCPQEGGYSIGFDSKSLLEVFAKQHFSIEQCIYDLDVQREILSTFISQTLALAKDKADPSAEKGLKYMSVDSIASMLGGIRHHLPVLKHPEFAEEQEWRAVSEWQPCTTYRTARSLAIPATRLQLVESPAVLIPLKKVIVGPCAHTKLAVRGVVHLLESNGYTREQAQALVVSSDIPYRLL